MTVMSPPTTTLYPARKGPRPLTAEDLWTIPRVGSPTPSPDGTMLVVPVTRWDIEKNESRTRLWLVPAKGGEPRALTSELCGRCIACCGQGALPSCASPRTNGCAAAMTRR